MLWIIKKTEYNLIGIGGVIVLIIGCIYNNEYFAGLGTGVLITALHFRLDYLGK